MLIDSRIFTSYSQSFSAIFLGLVFCLTIICPLPAIYNEIRIGIVGDQTGTRNIDEAYAALQKGVNMLSNQDLAAVLHVGDMAESREHDEIFVGRLNKAMDMMDGLGRPWYLTPGEHDVNPKGFEAASSDRSMEKVFQEEYAKRNPKVSEHLYHSFDIGDYHFVALYSHDNLHVDPL